MNRLFRSSVLAFAVAACNPKTTDDATVKPGDGHSQATDSTAQVDDSPRLALDPAVRTGKLDNGLTYYIRKHPKPAQRALLWLAVNAGSVLEQDDQQGLAHFIEHMAFNGTKRFEKNTMIDFFEKSGMDFGADVNAYTSFDETVYTLQVPTDDPTLLNTGLDVLEDWAAAVSFEQAEVDKERGVVIEEWRLDRGADQRVFDKQWPVLMAGSKYADRQPIGKKPIIESAPVARLKAFYDAWYRPDNMAVIVVGDIDPATMETEIRRRFAGLKNPADAPARPDVAVPMLDETRVDVQTDDELTMTRVSVAFKGPRTALETERDFRDDLTENLFDAMMRARFAEIAEQPDAPYAFAVAFAGKLGRAADVFRLFAGAKPGMADRAMETLVAEFERVRQHGFLASEFDRVKAELMRDLERAVAEADTTDASEYAEGLVAQFLEGSVMTSHAEDLALAKKFMPTITLAQVNALAQTWAQSKDRVVSAAGASRDKMPSGADLLAIMDAATKAPLSPWKDAGAGGTLMATTPTPGTITKKERIEALGLDVWTLSNGARVVIKPTDFKNDEILFDAFAPGGHSLAPDKTFVSAEFADAIVSQSGVGSHDAVSLGKLLSGKVVSVQPSISELEEGMQGSASPQDLETLLQLVHLYFTAPRKDPNAVAAWKGQMNSFLKNRDLDPQAVFFDAIKTAASSGHLRRQPVTVAAIDSVDLDTSLAFYRARFANARGFTFVFVGNVDEARLEDLATQYLASLPSTASKERWRDVGVKQPKGVLEVRVDKGQDPKSFVLLSFFGKATWTPENEDDLDMLSEALSIRLREILREDKSGVYGVFSQGGIERRPKPRYQFSIGFGCAPDNAESLTKAVFSAVEDVKKAGIDPETVEKIKQQRRRQLQTAEKENRFWLQQLGTHYRYGTDPRQILELDKKVDRVTSDRIKKAAKTYLDPKRYVDALLMPAP